ncbi:type III-A CRISPR-associated protein Cas10/Csm1 [Spirosoma areae]
MTNTETRELVYLAGLLQDERVQNLENAPQLITSIRELIGVGATDWLNPLLKLATDYAAGAPNTSELAGQKNGNRLESVFPNLHASLLPSKPYYFRMGPVVLDKTFFPEQIPAQTDPSEGDTLWRVLGNELKIISGLPTALLADSWLYCLEKNAVTIPSRIQHLPDVSLYDHLKSTAAIALCLYDYLKESSKLERIAIENDEELLLLIGGDLSGIQAFIYDIIGRSAAKNLKGRSFYLQLVVDSIVEHLLEGLNLRRANIVYSSGGGFYLLAPNTKFTRQTLPILQQEIAAKLREEQGVKLYLAIDSQPVGQHQVFGTDRNNTIGKVWGSLTEKLAAQKKRRFAQTLATTDYTYFFEPSEIGGESRGSRDAITNEEFRRDPTTGKQEEDYPIGPADNQEEYNQRVRKPTFEQIRLGRTLRQSLQYIVKSNKLIAGWEKEELFGEKIDRHFNPLGLGQYYYFVGEGQTEKFSSLLKEDIDNVLIQRVNDTQSSDFQLPGSNQRYGFTFYGGNSIPRDEAGEPKYFEELTGPDSLNFKRLGILRMDVDNLGFLFKNGFSTSKRTFSRYSTLSRSLDYFFKGYLNKIRENDSDFRKYTFILYAGGDDLFIVGKWDVILRFAQQIQTDFAAWTCGSDSLGISGGVAVVPPKFPIAKAADQSADEEKRAKNHDLKNQAGKIIAEKSSLCLFGTPLGWGVKWQFNGGLSEWQIVTELKNDLKRHIGGEKNIPKSLISKISTLHTMQQEQTKNKQNPSWRWMSAYDLGRARERAKSKEAQAFFDQLKTDLFTNNSYKGQPLTGSIYKFLDLLNVAARWAELEMRSEDTQTEK